MLLFIEVMTTLKHRVNLQLPTLVPLAITVVTQHSVYGRTRAWRHLKYLVLTVYTYFFHQSCAYIYILEETGFSTMCLSCRLEQHCILIIINERMTF